MAIRAWRTCFEKSSGRVRIVRRTRPWLVALKTSLTLGNSIHFGQDELSGLPAYKALDTNGCAQVLMDSLLPTTRSSRLNPERKITLELRDMVASPVGIVANYSISWL